MRNFLTLCISCIFIVFSAVTCNQTGEFLVAKSNKNPDIELRILTTLIAKKESPSNNSEDDCETLRDWVNYLHNKECGCFWNSKPILSKNKKDLYLKIINDRCY